MIKHIVLPLGICVLFASSLLSGCVVQQKGSTLLSIVSFGVDKATINQGQTANLSWTVLGATTVSIDHGIGTVALTGTRTVAPTTNTTYTLTAINGTATQTATVTVTVNPT